MREVYRRHGITLLCGAAEELLPALPDESVNCCVTSPPYWGLRDYGVDGQIGWERDPEEYVERLVSIFREVRRILKSDGTLWLNLGDTYAANRSYQVPQSKWKSAEPSMAGRMAVAPGLKPKDLVGIPWRVAFALQRDGWFLRQDIIWEKSNAMPESVKDRCVRAHEYVFLFSKNSRYYFDYKSIMEPAVCRDRSRSRPDKPRKSDVMKQDGHGQRHNGFKETWFDGTSYPETRSKRDVWSIPTQPYEGAHFAVFPPALVVPCISAGCPPDGAVLDPFGGSGTTGFVAARMKRKSILIELNSTYCELAAKRFSELDRTVGKRR